MKFEFWSFWTLVLILTLTAGTVTAGGRNGTTRSGENLKITAKPWGPTPDQYEASKSRVLKNNTLKSSLSGTYNRLLSFVAVERIDVSKNSLPPTHFRAFFYDYTNGKTIIAEGDFAGRETIRIRESDKAPDVGVTNEEVLDGYELVKSDPKLGDLFKSGKIRLFDPMPPITYIDGERLVNIGVRNIETGVDEILGVSFKNRKVIFYGENAPPTGVTGGNCGIPNSGQGSSSSGTGTLDLSTELNNEMLWEMLVVRPSQSSGNLSEGSGIEIRDVKYKGKSVLRRGHAPILNVKYHPGGCGSFRDWQDAEGFFSAPAGGAQNPLPGYRVLATGNVAQTAVESGNDTGDFQGVAIYQQDVGLGTELVLVTEMNAGWYRYIMEWRFAPDGTIRPRYGFGSVSNGCVCAARDHHVYWRLDFDIVNSNNDVFKIERGRKFQTQINTESKMFRSYQTNRSLLVKNSSGNEGYLIVPNITDEEAYFKYSNGSQENYGAGDLWVLRFSGTSGTPGELDDPNSGSAANIDPWVNGQSVVNSDLVIWYGAHQFRNDATSLTNFDRSGLVLSGIHTVGPDLRPVLW